MTNQEIGNRIKEVRTQLGKTLEDVANDVGVARSTIQRYENGKIGKIKLPVISAISDSLGINDAWLVGKSEEKFRDDASRFAFTAEIFNKNRHERIHMETYRKLSKANRAKVEAYAEKLLISQTAEMEADVMLAAASNMPKPIDTISDAERMSAASHDEDQFSE